MEVRPIKDAEELANIESKMRDAQVEYGAEVIISELPEVGSVVLVKNKGNTGRLPEFGYIIAEKIYFKES